MATSRIVAVDDLGAAELTRWEELASAAVEPNAFFTPQFLRPTSRHFASRGSIGLLVVEDGDEWIALLPLETFHKGAVRGTTNSGEILDAYSSLGSPLLGSRDPSGAATQLVRALREHRRALGHVLDLRRISTTGTAGAALLRALESEGLPVTVWGTDERAAVNFSTRRLTTWSDAVPASRAKVIRRRTRRLVEFVGSPPDEVRLDRTNADVAAYLEAERHSWKSDPSRQGPGFTALGTGIGWLEDVVAGFNARGEMYQLVLRAGEATPFTALVLRSGSSAFLWYDVYDHAYEAFGPGVLGRVMTIECLAADGIELLDTCMIPGRYPEQDTLYPDRISLVSCTVSLGPWPYAAALTAQRFGGKAKQVTASGLATVRSFVLGLVGLIGSSSPPSGPGVPL